MGKAQNNTIYTISISGISLLLYLLIAFHIPRYDTIYLLSSYFLLFTLYLVSLRFTAAPSNFKILTWAGIGFRLVFIFALPSLSDDVYRFIWDGQLLANGINPFTSTPLEILNRNETYQGINELLFNQFGKDTYSSYPPLNQLVFYLSVIIGNENQLGSIVSLRLVLLLFELGNLYLLRKCLSFFNKSEKLSLLYFLNPLVIIEITGNLHFEGMMIFFLLLVIYFSARNKWGQTGVALSMAILSKLIPLIFVPLLFNKAGTRKGIIVVSISIFIVLLAFIPFFDFDMLIGIKNSLGLYFQKFEFNASIYYLVRFVGFWNKGYNIIQTAGPWLGILTGSLIVTYSFGDIAKKTPIPESMMWILMIYFMFTTTLHPWYITTLLALSLFTSYKFPLVWTAFIFFTYAGYLPDGYKENYWLIGMEYTTVYTLMLVELIYRGKKKAPIWGFTINQS